MAVDHITTTAHHGAFAHVENALHTVLDTLLAPVRRWAEYDRITDELSGYSDRNLRDIGINRCEIERVARDGASNI